MGDITHWISVFFKIKILFAFNNYLFSFIKLTANITPMLAVKLKNIIFEIQRFPTWNFKIMISHLLIACCI